MTARYRRIVAGTDGSATAAIAVEHAAALAATSGGELLIVTALHPDQAPDVPEDLQWTITDSAVVEATVPNKVSPHAPCDVLIVRTVG